MWGRNPIDKWAKNGYNRYREVCRRHPANKKPKSFLRGNSGSPFVVVIVDFFERGYAMDCNFMTADGRFNFRAAAVISHGGKLLGMRDKADSDHFHYRPGGRVHLNETMEEALQREIWEELGVSARVVRPLWLRESLDGGDEPPYHGFEMYFLVELDWGALPSLEGPFDRVDSDGCRHSFQWLELGNSPDYIHPDFVQESFPNLPERLTLVRDKNAPAALPGGDVKSSTPEGLFNFRTAGVFVRNGLLLAMKEPNIDHYYLPGGRVRMNETMEEALRREMGEELGLGARDIRPLWLCESFFVMGDRPVHEIAMYYLAELDWEGLPALEGEFTRADSDGEEHIYRWLTEEEVRSVRIYPVPMQECWPELPEEFTFYSDVRDRRTL